MRGAFRRPPPAYMHEARPGFSRKMDDSPRAYLTDAVGVGGRDVDVPDLGRP